MAKQIITRITDDIDGSEAEETVTFALDGIGYEVDLNGKNALAFREFMSRYMEAGTRTGRVENGRHAQLTRYAKPPVAQATANRELNTKIRVWAEENGWSLADRGRIPQHIIDAFESKTPNPQWLAKQSATKVAEEAAGEKPAKAAARRRGQVGNPAFAG